MTEKQLLGTIIDLARMHGWRVAHFRSVNALRGDGSSAWRTPIDADGKGFPDLLLVRERVLAAEAKGGAHRPTPEQDAWLSAFRLAGVTACVWIPRDLENGAIVAELRRRVLYTPVEHPVETVGG